MTLVASRSLGEDIRRNIGFIVKAAPEASDSEVNAIKLAISATGAVDSYVFSSAQDIMAEESAMMGEDLDSLLTTNPFGAEFDVKVAPAYANSDSIKTLAARLQKLEGVDEIITETAVVDSVNSVLNRFTVVLLAIAAALMIISFVLINNTVSLAVYSRRFIIHTMKLVGATGAFIRKPFLLAGVGIGAVAAIVTNVMLVAFRVYGATLDAMLPVMLPWTSMWIILVGELIVGPLICLVASAIATNRYLRADYDDMFMK